MPSLAQTLRGAGFKIRLGAAPHADSSFGKVIGHGDYLNSLRHGDQLSMIDYSRHQCNNFCIFRKRLCQ
jgi:hypothetical protein